MDFDFENLPEEVKKHLQSAADAAKATILGGKKRMALELESIESEIGVAEARVAVAEAEIALVEHELGQLTPLDKARSKYLQAKIALLNVLRDKHQAEVAALQAQYESKQKVAEASLGIDPTLAMQMITGQVALTHMDDMDDPDDESGQK